ncbi:unnamed protein product (macronuclear) [Paramecium tetraurelia]|uniref:TNFR-Cys domain-containing protein n=1 Tax=Paramecium tetraurelia TaxID=5888 RepID=A0D4K0_PARTE|nr:uncharacterized protein GSPATT00013433001 [Paramecium tetraurelia]CAK77967.1 unnamed protein product [Paramecium tetraurelia]|eukprot:XP_001445364.1 hypothetical protein (macronuclear) [Paramecium tetraurelia strain d4-2]
MPRQLIVYVDDKIYHQQNYDNSNNSGVQYNCNSSYLFFLITITLQHSSPSITISMIAENNHWGVAEFKLSINECLNGCNYCNSQECFNQELFLTLFNEKTFSVVKTEEGWQSGFVGVNEIGECYGFNYLKTSGGKLHNVFNLGQHEMISFQAKLLIFNSDSTKIYISVDDILVTTTNYIQKQLIFNGQICGYIQIQEINLLQYQHFSRSLEITISVDLKQYHQSPSFSTYIGLRDFQLFVKKGSVECYDWNIVPFDGCFSNIYDCVEGCGLCIKGICQDCLVGWEFEESSQSCIPICGDTLITQDEECDDGNLVAYDGCHKCKYSCPSNCRYCQFGKCLGCQNQHQILEGRCQFICDELEKTHYQENQDYHDFIILEGYQCRQDQFDDKFERFYFQQQKSLLNLNIRILEQQYNNSKFDYLDNCKVEQFGKCLECHAEYEFNFHKTKCIPKCQDGILIQEEVCDDGNRIQFDGCYKCLKSCQIECLFCSENKCYNCQNGWQLQDYQCKQICGDGQLAIFSNEQCDDPEDPNCTDCNYQCDNDCLICNQFQNCEICKHPFQMKNGKCLSICGDNIITPPFEQCDDGNDIPYDGCYDCQFKCSFGCIKCQKDNKCVQCDELNYILDTHTYICQAKQPNSDLEPKEEENNNDLVIISCNENQEFINYQCVNLCGNGILNSLFEQCDDGNNEGGDGCSALCFEEDSYKCINQNNSFSICNFVQQPNLELILLSEIQNQTKIIELGFSQDVYLLSYQYFEQIVEFTITPISQYQLSLLPIINITAQLNQPKYQISVQFLEPVTDPILQINIQQFSIYNYYDMQLKSNSKQLHLGTPFVLSKATQNRVNQVIKMNDAIVYSTVSIAGLLFVTGNYVVFFNLLDLLQSLSYIRYMEYKFPPHLSQFLETYTKISLQPILEILRVDELMTQLNGGTIPYLKKKSQKSNKTNGINQMYLMNAKGCYFSYFASLITYIICCLISSSKISDWVGYYFKKNEEKIKTLRLISIFQQKIQLQSSKLKNYYFSSGVFQLFYSTLQQQLFSTLLQFPEYSFNSIFEIINSVAALGSLLFLISIFVRLLSITTTEIKNKQKWKYFFQDSKTGFWAANFKPFQIYRSACYIIIITIFIEYPQAQSVLLSMQSFFYLHYLILVKPIKSNYEIAKLICREVILLIITGSFLVYSLELNHDQFMLYGWFHIALFCFLLVFTLTVDLLDSVQKTYYIHLKKRQTQERMKILQYYENPLQKFCYENKVDQQLKK